MVVSFFLSSKQAAEYLRSAQMPNLRAKAKDDNDPKQTVRELLVAQAEKRRQKELAARAEAEARLKQVKTWWYFANLNDGHEWP